MTDWLLGGKLPDASTRRGAFFFLVGVILNQNISGALAWRGVSHLSARMELVPERIWRCSVLDLELSIKQPPAVHPFASAMAHAIRDAAEQVCRRYDGDARRIWRQADNVVDVAACLTSFRQIGQHKADVAVFLLSSVYGELDAASQGIEQVCPSLPAYLNT